MTTSILYPQTLAPKNVLIAQTLTGMADVDAFNQQPYGNFNVGLHVQDNPAQVHQHRLQLLAELNHNSSRHITHLQWLTQVHGNHVVTIDDKLLGQPPQADAMLTQQTGVALAIMTADCVPIVLTDTVGTAVAAIHAGWQGLANGVIANTVQAMRQLNFNPSYAWIGACISQANYEVDDKVKIALALYAQHFKPTQANHYLANLPYIAKAQLQDNGVNTVEMSGYASYADERFYSYRRQARTGRMATIISMLSI